MYGAGHKPCGVLLITSLEGVVVMIITGKKALPHESFRPLLNFHNGSLNTLHY